MYWKYEFSPGRTGKGIIELEARKLRKKAKILLTDLAADRDREANIERYKSMTASAFASYAGIKLSMNLFTLCEMEQERREEETYKDTESAPAEEEAVSGKTSGETSAEMENAADPEGEFRTLIAAIRRIDSEDPGNAAEEIGRLRDRVTGRMKVLTAYTDFFELHEYILNRKEAGILGSVEAISPEQLAEEAFSFVFSDQDKMVVNARIRSVVEQLPVRMTKQRFYDILSEAIALYKGGELQSAEDFIQSIRDAALLTLPEGFDTMYPTLQQARQLFDSVSYKDLDEKEFTRIDGELRSVTMELESLATRDLMLQEIINDILILLLTKPNSADDMLDDHFAEAKKILDRLSALGDDPESFDPESFDEAFLNMEGAQEEAYETLLELESSLEDYMPEMKDADAEALRKADLLTSTSLFMDLEGPDITVAEEKAGESEIETMKQTLFRDFDEAFKGLSREEKRSRMAKVLSMVPVFFNSREEIKEYFLYALENCRDDSELTAVSHILREMMRPEL